MRYLVFHVTYLRDGKAYRVKGKQSVLACWNMMIPFICPELPQPQKEALRSLIKTPLVITSVALTNCPHSASVSTFSRMNAPGTSCQGMAKQYVGMKIRAMAVKSRAFEKSHLCRILTGCTQGDRRPLSRSRPPVWMPKNWRPCPSPTVDRRSGLSRVADLKKNYPGREAEVFQTLSPDAQHYCRFVHAVRTNDRLSQSVVAPPLKFVFARRLCTCMGT